MRSQQKERGWIVNWSRLVPPTRFTSRDERLDDQQEQAFLEISADVLASEFPNPDRIDCPDSSVLQRIASTKLSLRDATPWMKHLGSCSECYRDFEKYKEVARRRRVVRLVYSMAASVLLAALLAIAVWKSHRNEIAHRNNPHQQITPNGTNGNSVAEYVAFVLDLRNAAHVRGKNGTAHSVMKVPRMPLHVLAYLPMGSDSGEYSVSMKREGKPVWSGAASAHIRDNRMVAEFDDDFTAYAPARYVLELSSKSGMHLVQSVDVEEVVQRK